MRTVAVAWLWWTSLCCLPALMLTDAAAQPDRNLVYTVAEREPEFPGGKAALSRYLAQHIRIPSTFGRKKLDTGPIAARFIVGRDGTVRDVRVTTKPLDRKTQKAMQEFMTGIIAAVEKMPRWRPGEVSGRPVAVFYTLPIEVAIQ